MNDHKQEKLGYKRMIEDKYMFNVENKKPQKPETNEIQSKLPFKMMNDANFTNEYRSPIFHKIKPDKSLVKEFNQKWNSGSYIESSSNRSCKGNKNVLVEQKKNSWNIPWDADYRVSTQNESLQLGENIFGAKCYHMSQYEMNSIKNSLKNEQSKLDADFDSFNVKTESRRSLDPIKEKLTMYEDDIMQSSAKIKQLEDYCKEYLDSNNSQKYRHADKIVKNIEAIKDHNQESDWINEPRNQHNADFLKYSNMPSKALKNRGVSFSNERKSSKPIQTIKTISKVRKHDSYTPLKSLSPYTSASRQDYDSKNLHSKGKVTTEHYQPTFENNHCQGLFKHQEVRDPNNSFIKKKLLDDKI